MAKRSTEPVVLVDGDLQFGDVSVMLGLPPQNTVARRRGRGAVRRPRAGADAGRQDPATGLLVLPAPVEPMPTDALLPGEMVNICAALQAIAGHVVVDMPSVFDDYVLALLEAADDVLLVGSMDIPSIKNLKIGMQTLDLQAVAGPKLRLVLNHANAKVKLDVQGDRAGARPERELPGPRRHRGADLGERGRPVVVDEPKSPVSRALEHIAESLLGPDARHRRRAGAGKMTIAEDGRS